MGSPRAGAGQPQPGEKALDVACGNGSLTRALAEAVGADGQVAAVDISPDMLSLARKLTDGRLPAIEWHACDAQNLPFEDSFINVAFCQLGLMFIPDKVAALKEMRRVLKSSGRLAVMVWGAIENCPRQMATTKTWEKQFGEDQAARFYSQHSLSDSDMVLALLGAAGFQEIDFQRVIGTTRFPSPMMHTSQHGRRIRAKDTRGRHSIFSPVNCGLG